MSLLFTSLCVNKGDIIAVYSGRFAFIREHDPEDINNDFNDSYLKNIANKSIKEEREHSKYFLQCKSGLMLTGMRWVTRILWLVTKNRKHISNYYKLRTIFYGHMYDLHERAIENKLNNEGNDIQLLKELKQKDKDVLSEWKKNTILVQFFGIPYALMGYLVAKHFTIVSINTDQNIEHESEGGFLNDIGNKKNFLKKHLLKYIIIEHWFSIEHKHNVKWTREKFLTEKSNWNYVESIREKNGKASKVFSTYEDYALHICDFVCNWANVENMHNKNLLFFLAANPEDDEVFKEMLKTNSSEINRALSFFYYHGN